MIDQQTLTLLVGAVGLAGWKFADRRGWIPSGPVAEAAQRRAEAAEEELRIANSRIALLEKERTLAPIIATQNQMLTRLTELTEAIKFLAGQVVVQPMLRDDPIPARPEAAPSERKWEGHHEGDAWNWGP